MARILMTSVVALSLCTSVGWAARLTPTWAVGVEAVGEDLEGVFAFRYRSPAWFVASWKQAQNSPNA